MTGIETMGQETEVKPLEAETTTVQPIETAEDGWEEGTGEGEVEEGEAKPTETEPVKEEKPEEVAPPKLEMDPEAKKFRDRFAVANGEAETLRKLAKKMEADGFLDRDEIAKELGKTRGEVDALIDRKPVPEPGEQSFLEQQASQFKADLENPVIVKAVKRMHGDKDDDLKELVAAYQWAEANDPEVKQLRDKTAADDFTYMVFDEGKKALEEFREAKGKGGQRSLLAENRQLKAQIDELKSTPKDETKVEANENNEVYEDPLVEREKRLRALRP